MFVRDVLVNQVDTCNLVKLVDKKETERDAIPDINIEEQIVTDELIDELHRSGIQCSDHLSNTAK